MTAKRRPRRTPIRVIVHPGNDQRAKDEFFDLLAGFLAEKIRKEALREKDEEPSR